MSNVAFDLDAFIAGVNSDKTQKRDPKENLNKLSMNSRDNQGTVMFMPVMSRSNNNFYTKIPRVYEYYGETSLIDNGEGWMKILPIDAYGQLTSDQIELYGEVKGLLDSMLDDELVDYNELRVRNYVLFYGICISMKNSEGKVINKYDGCPCLFVYPTNAVIDAFGVALNTKIDALKGNKTWIPMVLSPNNTGRKGAMIITCTKAAGPGYDVNVAFELNTEFNQVVDPNYVIPDEIMSKFDDIQRRFLGWNYGDGTPFNEVMFKELRDSLQIRYKELTSGEPSGPQPADASVTYENKNDLTPTNNSMSAQGQVQNPQPIKKTPF